LVFGLGANGFSARKRLALWRAERYGDLYLGILDDDRRWLACDWVRDFVGLSNHSKHVIQVA